MRLIFLWVFFLVPCLVNAQYGISKEEICRQIYKQILDNDPSSNPQLKAQIELARANAWTQYDKANAFAKINEMERRQQEIFFRMTQKYLSECQ